MPSETVCSGCGATFYSAAPETELAPCPQCGGRLEPADEEQEPAERR